MLRKYWLNEATKKLKQSIHELYFVLSHICIYLEKLYTNQENIVIYLY